MSKKYTAKQTQETLRMVICGAFEHMDAIKTELKKIGKLDETSDPNLVSRAKVLHLTLTCINDIIHPAHKMCYQLFEGADEYIKVLESNHVLAHEKKLLPPCYCASCDPDKSKAAIVIKELEEKAREQLDSANKDL